MNVRAVKIVTFRNTPSFFKRKRALVSQARCPQQRVGAVFWGDVEGRRNRRVPDAHQCA